MANDKNIATTIERQERDKAIVIETLKEMPIVQVACKRAGVSRATYYRWRQEDKDFKRQGRDAMDQGIEFINDMSESQVVTLIKEKKMPAIALWLKHHHPQYGSKSQLYTPATSADELSLEEKAMVRKALTLASNKTHEKHCRRRSRKNTGE